MPQSPKKNPKTVMARKALRSAGITRKSLAKTSGTTTKEVQSAYRQTLRAISKGGKIGAKDTKAVRKLLAGGPKAGVKAQPKRAAKMVTAARKDYKASVRAAKRKQPLG